MFNVKSDTIRCNLVSHSDTITNIPMAVSDLITPRSLIYDDVYVPSFAKMTTSHTEFMVLTFLKSQIFCSDGYPRANSADLDQTAPLFANSVF